ncbi:hypothetical protein GCM10009087_38050 [Sphingomonas oligophenolica]
MPTSIQRGLFAIAGFALVVPAGAQSGTSHHEARKHDPNEVLCEKQEVLGSRLAVKKICMTRAQWDAQRQSDRDLVDRSQLTPCVRNGGC